MIYMLKIIPVFTFLLFLTMPYKITTASDDLSKLDNKFNEVVEFLDKEALSAFNLIREKYGIIQSVKRVRKSVNEAVVNCSDKNEDIKELINTQFKSWSDRIDPLIEKSDKKMDDMIKVQRYIPAIDINEYFSLIDEEALRREKEINAQPVSDKSACVVLAKTMDKTKEKLASILEEELLLTQESIDKFNNSKTIME